MIFQEISRNRFNDDYDVEESNRVSKDLNLEDDIEFLCRRRI